MSAKIPVVNYLTSTLGSRIRIVTRPMKQNHSVSICLFVKVGSRNEHPEIAGITHLIEHLLFKGTEKRPSPMEISSAIEGVGGILNASTEQEFTTYWCKVPQPYMAEGIDLLVDMVRSPLFAPEELNRERLVIIEEQKTSGDHPDMQLESLIDKLLWPNHPLGQDIAGTRKSIDSITHQMVLDYFAKYYSPSNMVISVAGDIDHDDVTQQVDSLCEGWQAVETPSWVPFIEKQCAPRCSIASRKTEQSHLSIALPTVSATHPERYAIDVLNTILGEGMSSRLFLEVRERLGLAYDIQSSAIHLDDCGAFFINAGVEHKQARRTIATILEQLANVRNCVDENELIRAKKLRAGTLMLGMEDSRSVSAWGGLQELLTGQIIEVESVVDRINGVTRDQLIKAALGMINPDKLNLAIVGPAKSKTRFEQDLQL